MTAPIVAPSLLAADFAHLGDEARLVEHDADWLHIDVMDNHFVPNLTIGLPVVQSLRSVTALPFDVHLMIEEPRRWAPAYADAGAYNVTFHAEACDNPVALAKDLRSAGVKAGLAIDRDTPIEPYLEILPSFDTLLVMTIKAGFGGQRFLPQLLEKVRTARAHVDAGHLELRIEVDGGISDDTIEQAAEAGADAFVAGTAVYGADDPAAAVRRLRSLAARSVYRPRAVDPREGDARGTDTPATDPRDADPRGADPRGADPRRADTPATDPRAADARESDPRAADPRAADGGPERREAPTDTPGHTL